MPMVGTPSRFTRCCFRTFFSSTERAWLSSSGDFNGHTSTLVVSKCHARLGSKSKVRCHFAIHIRSINIWYIYSPTFLCWDFFGGISLPFSKPLKTSPLQPRHLRLQLLLIGKRCMPNHPPLSPFGEPGDLPSTTYPFVSLRSKCPSPTSSSIDLRLVVSRLFQFQRASIHSGTARPHQSSGGFVESSSTSLNPWDVYRFIERLTGFTKEFIVSTNYWIPHVRTVGTWPVPFNKSFGRYPNP